MKKNKEKECSAEKTEQKKIMFKDKHIKVIFYMLYDVVAVTVAYFLALWMRFDCQYTEIPRELFMAWLNFAPIYAVICVIVFWLLYLYRSIWKYASFVELQRISLASVILGAVHALGITVLFTRMPLSYYVIGMAVQFLLTLFVRFFYRFVTLIRMKKNKETEGMPASRVMLIGAGSAGQMILRDLHNAKDINERVCCIIDDNKNKWGCFIDGVKVVGGRDDILLNVEKYRIEKIYLTMPGATAAQRRDILDICKETHCQLKSLPGISEIVSCNVSATSMRDVAVEDLLGREPITVSMDEISEFISGKVVLVTGGGGSIGSELCRQIAKYSPKKLIVFDIYENNAHAVGLELRDKYP